MLLVRGHRLS